MKIAIPLVNGQLSAHFGHSDQFAIYVVDSGKIVSEELVDPPTHEHGSFPLFLSQIDCDLVISGGMGDHAQKLLSEYGIQVAMGAPGKSSTQLVEDYLGGKLEKGSPACTHDHDGEHHA